MSLQIDKAITILRKGGLVAFPTETVYGLGADANNEAAIAKIFKAKDRPFTHPLIVHIADINQLKQWAMDIPSSAITLAKVFWPGPLTLILKKAPNVSDRLTGGQETIGLRIPNHPIALDLLHAFGGGLAAPSANKFTHISPTTALDVHDELGKEVDLVLDGGTCEVGLESTIVDMTQPTPIILRPGMISPQAIASVLDLPLLGTRANSAVRTPGMHQLHYAPATNTYLLAPAAILSMLNGGANQAIGFLVHSNKVWQKVPKAYSVKMSSDPEQYAHDLYHQLRFLDKQRYKQIVVETVPETLEWEAIRDRLTKACCRISRTSNR